MTETVEVVTEVTPEQQAAEAAQQEQAAEEALRAGYAKAKGEQPAEAKVEAPAVEQEQAAAAPETSAEPETPETPAPDPWAGVNPALRSMLENISTKVGEVDKLGQRFKSFEGRLGHVQNAIDAARAAARASGTDAPTGKQVSDAMKDTKKWNQLMEDMGAEWKEAFEERLAAQAAEFAKNAPSVDVATIKKELTEGFTQSVSEIAEASTQKARQLAQLDIKYPTWEADIQKPEFSAWLKTQAPEKQALVESERASDALQLLDAYAEHRKAVEKREKQKARLAGVVVPQQATSGGPTVLPDEAGLSVGYNRVKRK